MTKIIFGLLIFCVVLFIYLHIMFHLKTSSDLEIYDIDETSKEKIEEIFDLRQPVLFPFYNDKIIDVANKTSITSHYGSYDIKIRNKEEESTKLEDTDYDLHVPLSINVANKLFSEDKSGTYYSENNHEFLEESGILKTLKANDAYLRPAMVSNCYYDILFGSTNTFTPLRYEINYRNFFLVTQGSVKFKICAPHNKKHLYVNYDYDNFEFSSPINPWSPQAKYKADFERAKFAEFVLTPGKMLFLPAHWWYSIQILDNNTSVSCFRYRTYMNNLAISPYLCLHLLQLQNIKRVSTTNTRINIKPVNPIKNTIDENDKSTTQENNDNADEIIESTNITDLENTTVQENQLTEEKK